MKETYQISGWQTFVIVFLTSFCMTPFSFASLHISWGRHMWIPAATQLLVTLLGSVGVASLWRRYPGQSLFSLAENALGPFFSRAYLLLLALYLYLWGPIGNEASLVRMINASELPRTSPLVLTMVMTAAVFYAAWFGSEVIGRVGEAWSLFLVPLVALVVAVSYSSSTLTHLLPIGNIPWHLMREAYFWSFALGVRGFIIALAFTGMLRPEGKPFRSILAGTTTAQLLITGMVMLPHTVFSGETIRRAKFQFIVLEALDTVNLSSLGVQSFLSITLSAWYIISWIVVAASIFGAAFLAAQAFGLTHHRGILILLTIPGLGLSVAPLHPEQWQLFTNLWSGLGYFVGVLGPWLLLLLLGRHQSTQPATPAGPGSGKGGN